MFDTTRKSLKHILEPIGTSKPKIKEVKLLHFLPNIRLTEMKLSLISLLLTRA